MKEIILTGDSETHLFPITKAMSKQMTAIYDKEIQLKNRI